MTRVLVQGDLHGNKRALQRALRFARANKCSALYQLGDFGFGWDVTKNVDAFVEFASTEASRLGIPIFWIDGNHENFDRLEAIGAFGSSDPVEIAPALTYLPRGVVQEVDGLRILMIGGAFSIDKGSRIWGRSWWPQETVRPIDVDRCLEAQRIDIVFSHDAPQDAFTALIRQTRKSNDLSTGHVSEFRDSPEARANREALQHILEVQRPRLWVHGHYHAPYSDQLPAGTRVIGLDMECEQSSVFVLDSDCWSATMPATETYSSASSSMGRARHF